MHDFCIALALRIEIRSTFAAAHGQCGEAILKKLFEAEKLENVQVYGRYNRKPPLYGPIALEGLYRGLLCSHHLQWKCRICYGINFYRIARASGDIGVGDEMQIE